MTRLSILAALVLAGTGACAQAQEATGDSPQPFFDCVETSDDFAVNVQVPRVGARTPRLNRGSDQTATSRRWFKTIRSGPKIAKGQLEELRRKARS